MARAPSVRRNQSPYLFSSRAGRRSGGGRTAPPRRALVQPAMLDARLGLARALADRGDRDAARAAAREALQRAEPSHPNQAAQARGLLDELGRQRPALPPSGG